MRPTHIAISSRPTIGILAGMGPGSTAPFFELVVAQCRKQYGAARDGDFPQMVIVSQPVPFFHDRQIDHAAVETATIAGLHKLEAAGVDFIAIACNSAHVYFAQLQRAVGLRLLNMVEVALGALPQGTKRIAIAASRPLARSGLYREAAIAKNLEVVEPEWQSEIDALQDLLKTDSPVDAWRTKWRQLFDKLSTLPPVDAVIVGCLDLSSTLKFATAPVPLIDAAESLAARLISDWLAHDRKDFASTIETNRGAFTISTDRSRLRLDAVHHFLTRSYWAEGISRELVARSIENSLCFGVYDEANDQVGFARVVTDHATFAYLCDVYVLEQYRGLSLGKALIKEVKNHAALKGARRAVLATRDAHGLYAANGFKPLAKPETLMEINRQELYGAKP